MGKKTIFTNITPLPPQVSREVAIAMLHDHDQMIELNPLVIEHHPIKTPRDSPKDEFFDCEWQELTDRVAYPFGGVVKGRVTYKVCFHDLPYGLQTHVYAPMGVDIREKWSICGTLPGEPEEPRELGLNMPRRGLYIREDGEIKCNIIFSTFVRKTLDSAHKVLVDRILSRAQQVQTQVNSCESSSLVSAMSLSERPVQTMQFTRQHGNTSVSDISRPGTMSSVVQPTPVDISQQPMHEPDPELASIHPALREEYRQSKALGHSLDEMSLPAYNTLENRTDHFYKNDVVKRPVGKHFAIERDDTRDSTGTVMGPASALTEREKFFVSELPGCEPVLPPARSNTLPDERRSSDVSSLDEEPLRLSFFRSASESEVDTAAFGSRTPGQKFDRFSKVSELTEEPTPKAKQREFNRMNSWTSVVSVTTEMTTPKAQQVRFTAKRVEQ